jgi:hypothetical protein
MICSTSGSLADHPHCQGRLGILSAGRTSVMSVAGHFSSQDS